MKSQRDLLILSYILAIVKAKRVPSRFSCMVLQDEMDGCARVLQPRK